METTFNGHAACKGTYEGHDYWDFFLLGDDIGEIYAKDPAYSDVVTAADGMKYVRNQLLVSAKMDCTKDKMGRLTF